VVGVNLFTRSFKNFSDSLDTITSEILSLPSQLASWKCVFALLVSLKCGIMAII